MLKSVSKVKKFPNGHCKLIADTIGGTSRFYVSRVLANPEKHNGTIATKIKEISKSIEKQNDELKAAFRAVESQNIVL